MRAPTYLGLYLLAEYPDQAGELEKKFSSNSSQELDMRLNHSIPTKYAKISIKKDSFIKELIETWSLQGMEAAHTFFANIDNRYGKNNLSK